MHLQLKVFVCLLACAAIGFAQGDRGTITGVVTDPSGAAAPGVAIEAIHEATNAKVSTLTTSTGAYRLVNLPVGIYNLTAKAAGFQTYARTGIQIQVNQTATINIPLRVGEVTETITVEGGAR